MKKYDTDGNLFQAIPTQLPTELFETLWQKNNLQIERIVSRGHVTPDGEWYDQTWDEWVMLLQGQAIVRYEQDNVCCNLQAGDYVLIPAHTKHRVDWTQPDVDTIWLALHLR